MVRVLRTISYALRILTTVVLSKDKRNLHDPSSKMWAFCTAQADEHDTAMVDRWKADMDGILIYVRLVRNCLRTRTD